MGQTWHHGQTSAIPLAHMPQATQRSKSRQKFRNSCGPRKPWDFRGRIHIHFLCWTTLKPSNEQTCVEKRKTRLSNFSKQFQLGHWCFCGPGQHRQENDAKVFAEASHPNILVCSTFLEKRTLSPRRTKGPFTFRVRLKQKTILIRTVFGMQSIMHLRCSVCFGLIRNNLNKKAISRFLTRKDSNCFGRPHARQQKPLLKCHKMQVSQQKLATANTLWPDPQSKERRWTLVWREYTLPRDNPTQNSWVLCENGWCAH